MKEASKNGLIQMLNGVIERMETELALSRGETVPQTSDEEAAGACPMSTGA